MLTVSSLFADSFENGQWDGNWVEDSQDDWFRSTRRAAEGSYAAEIDGTAGNATLTMANPPDLTAYGSADLTFSWFIESNWDNGEYIALDLFDGTNWNEVRRIEGVSGWWAAPHENMWHTEMLTVDSVYLNSDFNVRFRSTVSSSGEDGHVDNVQITGVPSGPPEISINDATILEEGQLDTLVPAGSGGLDNTQYLAIGPDDSLYVGSYHTDSVLRYDASTGAFIDVFVAPGAGGLDNPQGMAFDSNGYFYIASGVTDNVLRYDATTGAFVDEFVTSGVGGLDSPKGMAWGADGNLYVTSGASDSVLRFDGNGSPLSGPNGAPGTAEFVPAGGGGLDSPRDLTFGPDGALYVASRLSGDVLRYDSTTGVSLGAFVLAGTAGLDDPWGLAFSEDGYLYVSRVQADSVLRFDGSAGSFVDVVATSFSGIDEPAGLLVAPDGALLIANRLEDSVRRFAPGVTVSLSSPATETTTVNYSTASGSATASDFTSLSGTLTFSPGESSKHILVAATNDSEAEPDETFVVTLSNSSGNATIGDATSVVTITDDDSLRQISIDDATVAEGDDSPHYRGAFVDGLPGGHFNALTFGPDGYVYTAVGTGAGYNTIQKYDGTTGEFVETFMDNSDPDHKINGVRDIVFHPTDGYVYVASAYTDEVLRYDAQTGDFVDVFVAANSGGIDHPDGMMFGPDSNSDGKPELYVTGWLSHSVVRYDGATGQPLGTYIAAGSGGLSYPFSLALRNDELFVTSSGTNQILKYNADTGAYLDVASTSELVNPRGLTFGPDDLLYVTSGDSDRILRFTPQGSYVDDYIPAGTAGLDNPRTPRFGPDGDLYVTVTGRNEVMRFGEENEAVFTVTLSTPATQPVTVDYATAPSGANPASEGDDYLDATGQIVFAPGQTSATLLVPTLDDTDVESDETFTVTLNSATGATIADGQGVGTIIDDDAARQISISDAAATEGDRDLVPIDRFIPDAGLSQTFRNLILGPDGNGNGTDDLYVVSSGTDEVLRYDGISGAFIDVFVEAGAGGLDEPVDLRWGADNHLYVTSRGTNGNPDNNRVLRFDGQDGTFIDPFVTGADRAISIDFGDDGHLYVAHRDTNIVERFNGTSGLSMGTFIAVAAGSSGELRQVTFGADLTGDNLRDLYVGNEDTAEILRYDATTGTLFDTITIPSTYGELMWIDVGTDGSIYASVRPAAQSSVILRLDGASGAILDELALGRDGWSALVDTNDILYVSGNGAGSIVDRFAPGSAAAFQVTLSSESDNSVTVDFSTAGGSAAMGSDFSATSGTLVFEPGVTTRTIIVPTLDDTDYEADETFQVVLSSPIGATIADSQAVGTIHPDGDPASQPPVAEAGGPYIADEGGSVLLDGSTSTDHDGTIVAWDWDLDNNGSYETSGATALFDAAADGVFSVGLRVTDDTGVTDTDTATVTVANLAPTANAGGSYAGNEGTAIQLNGMASTDPGNDTLTYAWDLDNNGSFETSGAAPLFTAPDEGTYTVHLRVTDSDGLSHTDTASVTVANVAPIADAGGPYTVEEGSAVTVDASGSTDPGSDTLSYAWDLDNDGQFDDATGVTAILSGLAVGTHPVAVQVSDGDGGITTGATTVTVSPVATGPAIDKGIATGVDNMGWTTVGNLDHSYTNMVVIATPNYDSSQVPLVTRIQNAGGDSFQVRVDRADGLAGDIGAVNVHYVVLEAGVYTMADDGVKMEVVLVNSTVTDENNSWVGQNMGYQQSYTSPVVVGQVMTYNDPAWSTFWARGSSRTAPPSASALWVGKQVGEDPDATRANDMIGYVVVESGMGTIGDIGFEAGLGTDTIKGVGDAPSYDYSLSGTLPSFSAAVASQAGMDGGNGGWAVLYGTDPASINDIRLAIDEDRMKDSERRHTTEQVAFIVFDPPVETAAAADQVLSQGTANPLEAIYWADFTASDNRHSKPKKDKANDLALLMMME